MSLYLCVFDGEVEIAGVEVGGYADFGALREHIARDLEGGAAGSRFPLFMLHSDCRGEWAAENCPGLLRELAAIADEMARRPALPFPSPWQRRLAESSERRPASALECYLDIDGKPLLEQLQNLTLIALSAGRPILFQ